MFDKIIRRIKNGIKSGLFRLRCASNYAPPPRSLSIEITTDCNLHCFMCERNFAEFEKKNLSFGEFKYILEQLPKVRYIALVGSGETLMNPDLFEMLDFGKSRKLNFTIVTNGLLLNEKNIWRLNNVSEIYVSIDSPRPEIYKKIRGENLEVVINNMKNLKRIKGHIQLYLGAIIMRETIEDLDGLIELAKNVEADRVYLVHLTALSEELDKVHGHNFKNLKDSIRKAEQLARKYGIGLITKPTHPKKRICLDPWLRPCISIVGDVYPCRSIYVSPEPIWKEWYQGICLDVPQFQYRIGNIFQEPFNKIWNGKRNQLLRRAVRKLRENIELSIEGLNKRRQDIDLSKDFSYCQVCLFRWTCSC